MAMTAEERRAYKTNWERQNRKDPKKRRKYLAYQRALKVYKREWAAKKRINDPEFRAKERERSAKWRAAHPERIGVRKSKRARLHDKYEEMLPGHCQSCGIKLKDKTKKRCESTYCNPT